MSRSIPRGDGFAVKDAGNVLQRVPLGFTTATMPVRKIQTTRVRFPAEMGHVNGVAERGHTTAIPFHSATSPTLRLRSPSERVSPSGRMMEKESHPAWLPDSCSQGPQIFSPAPVRQVCQLGDQHRAGLRTEHVPKAGQEAGNSEHGEIDRHADDRDAAQQDRLAAAAII